MPSDEERRRLFQESALPHLDRVYGTALYLARDPDRAEDLVQETFLRAYRFFHQFEPGTNCLAWLLTILHNVFRNRYRAERREHGNVDVADPASEAEASRATGVDRDPESLVLGELLDAEIEAALRSLPEDFRTVVVLVDLQDLTYEEAAVALGCPIGTVRSRLSRGRRLLRKQLEAHAGQRGYRRSS